ncbi:MAG: TauD/TfdA family dioxygenase [Thalassobaculum sp.]|uniref:TauD/TfdA family dioxygenase n=1 Tax=Thalassobaculum sp. TaxID=2022740 RepID=UPI0032ED9973
MQFPRDYDRAAAWRAEDLERDRGWVFALGDRDRRQLAAAVRAAWDPERDLLDYRREEFDLGPGLATVAAAAREAQFGRGVALVRGLPRDDLGEGEFRLLSWAIGLQLGVARPQGKATHYLSDVRAAGMDYRSAGGRGYNSNAKLDFHADTCDLVTLACYNKARAGGQSMATSSVTAWEVLAAERPDLAEVALQPFHFSRNGEEAPDEAPFYPQPLFDVADGRLFCKWNRNRVRTAQELAGVPALTDKQREAADLLDEILRRPGLMFALWLEPGDMQIMNNHVALHSRTAFEDFAEPGRRRLLHRLWLAPPDSVRLPESWRVYFRAVEPGTVRGGFRGQCYDETRRAFEVRQAAALGMSTEIA